MRLRTALGLAVVAALIAGEIGTVALLSTLSGSDEPVGGQVRIGPPEGLGVCVRAIKINEKRRAVKGDAATEEFALGQVTAALPGVRQHPDFVPAGYGVVPMTAESGCASELSFDWWWGRSLLDHLSVEQASYYREFLIVVPSSRDLTRVIGDSDYRRVTQEFVCGGQGVCYPYLGATSAVYVTADELADLPFLACWLAEGAGLSPDRFENSLTADCQ
jgi:hypothetical protein